MLDRGKMHIKNHKMQKLSGSMLFFLINMNLSGNFHEVFMTIYGQVSLICHQRHLH